MHRISNQKKECDSILCFKWHLVITFNTACYNKKRGSTLLPLFYILDLLFLYSAQDAFNKQTDGSPVFDTKTYPSLNANPSGSP